MNLLTGSFSRFALPFHEALLSTGTQRDFYFTANCSDPVLCCQYRCKFCALTFCDVAYVSIHIQYLFPSTLNLKEKSIIALFFSVTWVNNWQRAVQNRWEILISWLKGLSHNILKGLFWSLIEQDTAIQWKVNISPLLLSAARDLSFHLFMLF